MEVSDNKEFKTFLFPYYFKFIGLVLILTGLLAGFLYFFGGKPAFFQFHVFAIVTAYLKTRYFVVTQTNILDEMAAIFLVSGLCLVSFSKEKIEKNEYQNLRLKAFLWAAYASVILWILAFLLFYGYSIFIAAPLVFICFFIFYNLFFRLFL